MTSGAIHYIKKDRELGGTRKREREREIRGEWLGTAQVPTVLVMAVTTSSVALEKPKSAIFTSRCESSKMFLDLRSR